MPRFPEGPLGTPGGRARVGTVPKRDTGERRRPPVGTRRDALVGQRQPGGRRRVPRAERRLPASQGACGVRTRRHPLAPLSQPPAPGPPVSTPRHVKSRLPRSRPCWHHACHSLPGQRGGLPGSAAGSEPGIPAGRQGQGSHSFARRAMGVISVVPVLCLVSLFTPLIKGCLRWQELQALPGLAAVPRDEGRCFTSRCTARICPPGALLPSGSRAAGPQLRTQTFPPEEQGAASHRQGDFGPRRG